MTDSSANLLPDSEILEIGPRPERRAPWGEGRAPGGGSRAVLAMDLRHAVIPSVNRDERPDGGAPIFALVIRRIRQLQPGCSVEVLIPDFKGSIEALGSVMGARPEVLQ